MKMWMLFEFVFFLIIFWGSIDLDVAYK